MKIRPARPTREEGLAFARHLDEATEGLMSLLLRGAMAERVASAFVADANEYSWENVLVAEEEGQAVAMAAGFEASRQAEFPADPLVPAGGWARLRYQLVGAALWPILSRIGRVVDREFYVLALATEPRARGRGAGSMLLAALESVARANGCSRLSLDVAEANEGAQRLYSRHGLAVVRRSPRWIPRAFRVLRMSKALSPCGTDTDSAG